MTVVKINAIDVAEGAGPELERRFANRRRTVDEQPGFISFELLRPVAGESRYFVLTRWEDEESFQAWRDGPAIEAHAGANRQAGGGHGHGQGPITTGASLLEFEVVLSSRSGDKVDQG
ncbi:MAG: antibiotic biosynthesis monooxygenase [Pseudonocardia sp.]|nr:antibiotic biosynthesis monooxygenase [Pseudonocardia sp.]